ncbi:MAG TPA: response regulator, partial [Allocoleopsis sp.]
MVTLLKPTAETDILIVDDNPDNLRLLAKILESQGYMVRKALNGRMALQTVHRNPPAVILLDITMPGINGYEVCQQLKANEATATIPVIFISALDCVNDKVKAFESGGQDYITKPFQEQEVLMRVRNQLLIQQQHYQLIQQNQRLEQEIAERLKAEAAVRQLSLTDELTGLHNRRGFLLLAEQ